jgi:hypothetical protein
MNRWHAHVVRRFAHMWRRPEEHGPRDPQEEWARALIMAAQAGDPDAQAKLDAAAADPAVAPMLVTLEERLRAHPDFPTFLAHAHHPPFAPPPTEGIPLSPVPAEAVPHLSPLAMAHLVPAPPGARTMPPAPVAPPPHLQAPPHAAGLISHPTWASGYANHPQWWAAGYANHPQWAAGADGPAQVQFVQRALNVLGRWAQGDEDIPPPWPVLVEDGAIADVAHTAIAAYQRARGLPVDGVPGPLTRKALAEDLHAANFAEEFRSAWYPPWLQRATMQALRLFLHDRGATPEQVEDQIRRIDPQRLPWNRMGSAAVLHPDQAQHASGYVPHPHHGPGWGYLGPGADRILELEDLVDRLSPPPPWDSEPERTYIPAHPRGTPGV